MPSWSCLSIDVMFVMTSKALYMTSLKEVYKKALQREIFYIDLKTTEEATMAEETAEEAAQRVYAKRLVGKEHKTK